MTTLANAESAAKSQEVRPILSRLKPGRMAHGLPQNRDAAPYEGTKLTNHPQLLREAVLRSFSNDASVEELLRISRLSLAEWQTLMPWLHASGLALYLLDRLSLMDLTDEVPLTIADRLRKNQADNTERTLGMMRESVAIQSAFQQAGVTYAVMKGVSLFPYCGSRQELRHQFDLDYLVEETSAPLAREVLEERGYSLFAISGKSWEFKIHETTLSPEDLYKDLPYRGVELHLERIEHDGKARMERLNYRQLSGITMPVFSPVDLFAGQAMHAFKDLCSSFSRAAHLLEFYRHVLYRRNDDAFWHQLRHRTEQDQRVRLGMGAVTYFITSLLGEFAPAAFTEWTVAALPASVRLYLDRYARRTVFSEPPGSKLYLLLQREMEHAGIPSRRPIKQSLVPSHMPPVVVRGTRGERMAQRMARYRTQLRFLYSRMQFHLVEGIRYTIESYRWKKALERMS